MVDLSSRIPAKLRPRADFKPEEFRKLVLTRGLRVTWELAAECPCVNRRNDYIAPSENLVGFLQAVGQDADINEPRVDCPTCAGKGYLYHSPHEIRAIFTSAKDKPDLLATYGEMSRGMASFSLLPEHLPSVRDRFTLTDSVMVYRETRTRTSTGGSPTVVEGLRYPVATRTLDLAAGPTTRKVLHCYKTNALGVAEAGGELVEDTDFVVNGDGEIDWTLGDGLGSAPVTGARYSVSYYCAPRYVSVDIPHTVRDTWIASKAVAPEFAALLSQTTAMIDFLAEGTPA